MQKYQILYLLVVPFGALQCQPSPKEISHLLPVIRRSIRKHSPTLMELAGCDWQVSFGGFIQILAFADIPEIEVAICPNSRYRVVECGVEIEAVYGVKLVWVYLVGFKGEVIAG